MKVKATYWKDAPAEPAEYTCPRCGSNVSTHICMGEPVAGETKRCQVCNDTGLECISRKTEAGDYDETFKPCTVCGRKPAYAMTPPAPSVAVPEGEAKLARTVTHQMARDAFRKMHDALYNNAPIPSLSIPARLDDADIALSDYICQQRDVATPPTNPVSTEKWRVGRKLGRTLYIGDRFIGSVDTPELASKIVEAVNAGGVSTAGMTAEEFAKTWEGFRGQTSILREGKELRPLADWQEAVAIRFAQAWAAHVLAEKGK